MEERGKERRTNRGRGKRKRYDDEKETGRRARWGRYIKEVSDGLVKQMFSSLGQPPRRSVNDIESTDRLQLNGDGAGARLG